MITEKMREEFEVWYLGKFCGGQKRLFRCVNADKVYYFPEVQSKWDTWQASRAAIEVGLPRVSDYFDKSEYPHTCDLLERDLRASIESLGLKVKP